MVALPIDPSRNTGPLELRGFGPTGRRLGTVADCYDGSRWELHRGELWEQMGSKDIHAVVMALLATLFGTHARLGVTLMTDVYCDLSDAEGESLRAPDLVLVGDLSSPRNAVYTGLPVLAVEIRGTQSKRYLEEKVKLYLEHAWPCTWIVHAERQEVEVLRPGVASVTYRRGADVPLPPELDRYGLLTLPVTAIFDQIEARRYGDEWVQARTQERAQAEAVLAVLRLRGIDVPEAVRDRVLACRDLATLGLWLAAAVASPTAEAFAGQLG